MQTYKQGSFSNSSRHKRSLAKMYLAKNNKLIKNLAKGIKQNKGRSSVNGRITIRHRGGGAKRSYRFLESKSAELNSIVLTTSYDPFRSAFLALHFDIINKTFFHLPATKNVYPGSLVKSSSTMRELKLGNRLPLSNIPVGSLIHSISLDNQSVKYVRAAGTFGQLIQKDLKNAKMKLPSGKLLNLSVTAFATLGLLSNAANKNICYGKAGSRRFLGYRPSVRGIAMNPVDHPHGGRTNGGGPTKTPWGFPAKGRPTSKKRRVTYK